MSDTIFSLHSWPKAIIHVDGDAFFTSIEEAIHPELRGKAIVTGGERGIIACASYTAKSMGIKRGVSIYDAKKICPSLLVLPSDYETYSLFSRRMMNIIRQYTPEVEEYSIDEAFADITGMRRVLHASYEDISIRIKEDICNNLGITVSVGLSITKVLAKIGSKHKKPNGMTIISGRDIPNYLNDLSVDAVWGIGPATTSYLGKLGIRTALEFAKMQEHVVKVRFTKPGREIWHELRGESVYPVDPEEKSAYASISKTKTFAPPTGDVEYLFAHLMRNLESACIKARRYQLIPKKIVAYLKKQNFECAAQEVKLNRPCVYPMELTEIVREMFNAMYNAEEIYRATGIILLDLDQNVERQYSLFEDTVKPEKIRNVYKGIDVVCQKYGKHALHLGGSHLLEDRGKGRRGEATSREKTLLPGETKRKHLPLPIIHVNL
jgi:nucleotidyltransferase/DNA polymerase involved in DNA repair